MQSLADAPAAYCRLFGTFSLEDARGAPVRIRSRRARALLAHLIVVGAAGASRERLSGLLWSDRAEEQARASLRQCLLELRRELTEAGVDALDVGRDQVVRRREGLEADLDQLEDAIRRQDGAALCATLERIGASLLLEGLSVGGLYDEWLTRTRAQLDLNIEREVRRLIDAAEQQGAWEDLRAIAAAFLLRSPADEAVAAAAIRADMALGISSAAHRRFRALEHTLASEYGVRPGDTVNRALRSSRQPEAPAASALPTRKVSTEQAWPIVVVSAFEGADLDEGAASLAQLVRDEVVSGLSRFRDLRVVTDAHPASSLDHAAFAHPQLVFALGARLRSAARPGLTIQLTRLHSHSIVWSDTFDIPEVGILGATDTIVARVVAAVLPSIDLDLVRPQREADSDSSYLRYVHARDRAWNATSHAEARAAAAELEELIRSHPNFVLPYPHLAFLYNTDFNQTLAGSSDAAMREEARRLAKTAMTIDRSHVHSYIVAAWGYLRERRWEPAAQLFEQALSLNPFNASRLKEIGFGLLFLDQRDRARELLDRCLLVNPVPEDFIFTDLGLLELVCGNDERAATYFELVANPSIWSTLYQAVNAELAGRGQPNLSRKVLDRIAAIWPSDVKRTDEAMIRWVLHHNPFRSKEVEDRFVSGVRMMLGSASAQTRPVPLARQ